MQPSYVCEDRPVTKEVNKELQEEKKMATVNGFIKSQRIQWLG